MSEESDLLLPYEKNILSFISSAHFLSLNGERIGVIDWLWRKREKKALGDRSARPQSICLVWGETKKREKREVSRVKVVTSLESRVCRNCNSDGMQWAMEDILLVTKDKWWANYYSQKNIDSSITSSVPPPSVSSEQRIRSLYWPRFTPSAMLRHVTVELPIIYRHLLVHRRLFDACCLNDYYLLLFIISRYCRYDTVPKLT